MIWRWFEKQFCLFCQIGCTKAKNLQNCLNWAKIFKNHPKWLKWRFNKLHPKCTKLIPNDEIWFRFAKTDPKLEFTPKIESISKNKPNRPKHEEKVRKKLVLSIHKKNRLIDYTKNNQIPLDISIPVLIFVRFINNPFDWLVGRRIISVHLALQLRKTITFRQLAVLPYEWWLIHFIGSTLR